MAIRIPLQKFVFDDKSYVAGAASINGGDAFPFQLPMDTDNVVVKLQASITGGGVSAIFQTSDDGGTTFYDVARTSIVSNTGLPAGGLPNAEWLSIPVISPGISSKYVPSLIATGSLVAIQGGTIGRSAASTLTSGQVSGLPILGQYNRLFLIYTGTVTATSLVTATVMANSQSATA
mgnify:CR=1 FL=1